MGFMDKIMAIFKPKKEDEKPSEEPKDTEPEKEEWSS